MRRIAKSTLKINIRSLILGLIVFALMVTTVPALAAGDNCPDVNAIGNFLVPPTSLLILDALSSTDTSTGTVTYTFLGLDPNTAYTGGYGSGATGVPGLITYCVYPQAGADPDGAITAIALGADGALVQAKMAKGSFSYTRGNGNPSNVPLDGNTYTMGTATWAAGCQTITLTDGTTQTVCQPPSFTIVLHINDASVCQALYSGSSSTCFVYPTNGSPQPPPAPACNGDPACKSATITDASGNDLTLGVQPVCQLPGYPAEPCPVVPMFTELYINYTYKIVNQPGNPYSMDFLPRTPSTKDINTGGGKDYYGCEQIPNPMGMPGNWITTANYDGTPFTFNFTQSSGNCAQSRFFAYIPQGGLEFSLFPGQSIAFTLNMETRKNKSGRFEYTSCGSHMLNSGFTVKWFQSNDVPADSTLHSFTTGVTPLYVYAVQLDQDGNPLPCSNP